MRWQGWAEARAARGLPPLLLESPVILCTWWSLFRTRCSPGGGGASMHQLGPRTQHGEWGPWAPGRLARASRARVCRSPAHCLSCSTPGPLRSHSSPLARAGPGGTQCAPPQAAQRLTSSRLLLRDLAEGPEVRLCSSMAGGTGSISAQELRSHVPHGRGQKRKTPCVKGPSGPHFPRQSPTARVRSAQFHALPSSLCFYSVSSCLCRQGRSS